MQCTTQVSEVLHAILGSTYHHRRPVRPSGIFSDELKDFVNHGTGTTQNSKFAVGDGFIVCDMGGGTVDLYVVLWLNHFRNAD